MCYITYAVPIDEIPPFPKLFNSEEVIPPLPFISGKEPSPEFMPKWFYAGGFPEDEE